MTVLSRLYKDTGVSRVLKVRLIIDSAFVQTFVVKLCTLSGADPGNWFVYPGGNVTVGMEEGGISLPYNGDLCMCAGIVFTQSHARINDSVHA